MSVIFYLSPTRSHLGGPHAEESVGVAGLDARLQEIEELSRSVYERAAVLIADQRKRTRLLFRVQGEVCSKKFDRADIARNVGLIL
jgi:hypothetical protein